MTADDTAGADPFGAPPEDDAPNRHTPYGRFKLERGWAKRSLMFDLARGGVSQPALGAKYGVTKQSIAAFHARHRAEIDEMAASLEAEFVGLWIADKRNRLAELQTAAEDLSTLLAVAADTTPPPRTAAQEAASGEADPTVPTTGDVIALASALTRILRSAAEELGQIPNRVRMDLGGTITTVRLEGVDVSRL